MRPTDLPPLQRLIERLVQLLNRPADARLVCITARCAHGVKSIDIDRPTLALDRAAARLLLTTSVVYASLTHALAAEQAGGWVASSMWLAAPFERICLALS